MTSPENQAKEAIENSTAAAQDSWGSIMENVRRRPGEYVALSFLLGFFLQVLPLRALLELIVRAALVAVRPAAIALAIIGILKSVRKTRAGEAGS
jgi:hypothetical protein